MSLPRYISIDLLLSARDMRRIDAEVSRTDWKFAAWVRDCVRSLAARNGIELGEVRSLPRVGPWAPDRYDVSTIRHAVLFPRAWDQGLSKLAKKLDTSKSGVARIAVLQRANGIR